MPIGDITSQERGSGARYNDGKPEVELLPLRIIVDHLVEQHGWDSREIHILLKLSHFQQQHDPSHLVHALDELPEDWIIQCAKVFGYGRRKYAAWNWSKGQPWSVPVGCIVRHALKYLQQGELLDPESGLPHYGHIACNLVMLIHFSEYYQEGNDLPPIGTFKQEPLDGKTDEQRINFGVHNGPGC